MMMRLWLLLSIGLLVLSCGKKKEEQEQDQGVIDGRYQGDWDYAHVPNTTDGTLFIFRCREAPGGSLDSDGKSGKDFFATTVTRYIGSSDCTGETYVKRTTKYTVEAGEKNDDEQIVKVVSYGLELVIKGSAAANYMNSLESGAGACAHTDWAVGTYTEKSDIIKDCTDANDKDLDIWTPADEVVKNMRIRFKPRSQGGIEKGEKAKDDEATVFETRKSYWLPQKTSS